MSLPNYDLRPSKQTISLVVIHCISLPPNKFGNSYIEDFFKNDLDISQHAYFKKIKDLKVSSHFLIKRKGELIQFVSCLKKAWHAGESVWRNKKNCNDFSIGIELEGSDIIKYEDIQYKVLLKLLKSLRMKYPVTDIVGHSDIAPGRKTDPGHFFDWNLINSENSVMFKKVFILFFLSLILFGCGQEEETEKKKQRIINISTSPVQIYNFKDQESAIGTIEGLMDPTIRSEIASSVKKIYTKTGTILKKGDLIAQLDDQDYRYQLELAEAELSQLKIRLNGQNKTYQRNSELVDENFISPNALDEIVNQKNETEELIKISEARAKIAKYRLSKTKIYSPISGKVERQIASIGDFLKIGDPIIQIMNNDRLRAHVPFPERLATKLQPGLPIELKSPIVEEKIIVKIAELKPQLISDSLSIDVIADIVNQPNWQAGGSVRGTVVFKEISNLSVPEQSIILRPAGQVVYVIRNDVAYEKSVQTGITQNGNTEITSGLKLGEIIAVEGAAYLTDEAKINITQN